MNEKYELIGGSLPKLLMNYIESEGSENSSKEFSEDNEMSSGPEDSG